MGGRGGGHSDGRDAWQVPIQSYLFVQAAPHLFTKRGTGLAQPPRKMDDKAPKVYWKSSKAGPNSEARVGVSTWDSQKVLKHREPSPRALEEGSDNARRLAGATFKLKKHRPTPPLWNTFTTRICFRGPAVCMSIRMLYDQGELRGGMPLHFI